MKYQIQTQWETGFTGTVDIKNTGAPWSGWQTTWTMPTGQKLTEGWNGQFTQASDKVTVGHLESNKVVRQNSSISFGFNASHTGLNIAPIDLAVNGTRCSGQADTLQLPPSTPTQLTLNLIENNYADLSWQDSSDNEDSFVLERRQAGGSWAVLATLAANTVNYQDKTLAVGITYEYRLKAVNVSGASTYTDILLAKRQDRTDIQAAILVNNCAACHGTDGYSSGSGTPSIAGLSKSYLVRTMKAYRTGERASSVMNRIAKGYTDTQIERMADYLAALPFKAASQTTDQALVNRGKAVHESNCAFCHVGTGHDMSLTGTRLDGQWAGYLHATLEDYYQGRSSNIPTEMAHQMSNLKPLFGEDVLVALAQYYAADATAKAGGAIDDDNGGGGDDGGNSSTTPAAPTTLTATAVDNSKVNLAWKDTSNNETGFRIERLSTGATENDWVGITDVASNTQAYTDTTVAMGMAYDYRVAAFNTVGSTASTAVTVTLQTALQYGQSQYQRQGCASCHGADGKGGFTKVDLTKYTSADLLNLTKVIHDTMPPGNPGACTDSCAAAIASYITEVLVPNANGGGGDDTQACVGSPPAGVRNLRLLTRQEYQNTVNDLLGL